MIITTRERVGILNILIEIHPKRKRKRRRRKVIKHLAVY